MYPVSLERLFGGEIWLQRRRGSGTRVDQGRRASVPRLGRDADMLGALGRRAALGASCGLSPSPLGAVPCGPSELYA